jgi:hypothetical protein
VLGVRRGGVQHLSGAVTDIDGVGVADKQRDQEESPGPRRDESNLVTVLDPAESIGIEIVIEIIDSVGVGGGHGAHHEKAHTPGEEMVVFDPAGMVERRETVKRVGMAGRERESL